MLFLMVLTSWGFAQKEKIIISDSLRDRADELPVKLGPQWMGKIYKIKFGEYNVGESKMGWTTSSQKAAIFNRETESNSKQKFSFELNSSASDVAYVNAITSTSTKALREWTMLSYSNDHSQFTISKDAELLLEANSFSAFITINKDTTDVWSLVMTTFKGSDVNDHHQPIALLTNGEREIFIVPITSNENGQDKRMFPACGYELKEDGRGLAAVQFYGGGTMGMNKNIVWLPQFAEPKMRLLLAAALTAILQTKANSMSF